MKECLNVIGGECISVIHMICFIITLILIGTIFGYLLRKIQTEEDKKELLEELMKCKE
ncbi:hypothetical protein GF336_00300 [Candidatus Woesearchaeota archaeon]|nr:hypothetical protein [Candidatus Woesearchaeota archaeon]